MSYIRTKGIIVNVSGAFTSFELMPAFYLYGYGLPFYNSVSDASSGVLRNETAMLINWPYKDSRRSHHYLRHQKSSCSQFWSVDRLDGGGVDWDVGVHCDDGEEE